MNIFEKSLNLGVGLFAYTRDKVEEAVQELVDKGQVAKNDAKDFANELMAKGEEQRNELGKVINEEVKKVLSSMNYVKKEEAYSSPELKQYIKEQITEVLNEMGISSNNNKEKSEE